MIKITATVVTKDASRIIQGFFKDYVPKNTLDITGERVTLSMYFSPDKSPTALFEALSDVEMVEFHCIDIDEEQEKAKQSENTKGRRGRKVKEETEPKPEKIRRTRKIKEEQPEAQETVEEKSEETPIPDNTEKQEENDSEDSTINWAGTAFKVKPEVPTGDHLNLNELLEKTTSFNDLVYIIGKKLNGTIPNVLWNIVKIALTNPNLNCSKVLDKMGLKKGIRIVLGKSSTALFGCNFEELLTRIKFEFDKRVKKALTNMELEDVSKDKELLDFAKSQILKDSINEDDMDVTLRMKLGRHTIRKNLKVLDCLKDLKNNVLEG